MPFHYLYTHSIYFLVLFKHGSNTEQPADINYSLLTPSTHEQGKYYSVTLLENSVAH
jgi:hypothetical protein